MKIVLQVKNFRWVFVTSLFIFILISIYAYSEGKQFDLAILADYQKLSTAISLTETGKHFEAIAVLEELDRKYTSSAITWLLASNYFEVGNIANAKDYYARTRTIYPAVVFEPVYLKEYIELLIEEKEYERARTYINFYLNQVNDPEEILWVDKMLEKLGS